ncbi:hypothetical protein GALMADRAFT_146476 [Galerina marginata CBS 339.88]|uniref:Uncharacterized protein n=1 Tax=Galerina marginata (strain CBS 339.88) TaxID=685588 RepID=A0A067SDZ9_GALM3|nr:hypothetical protein GALMADRAFT_146476 [Galerina marginata CBS 339.88]
MLNRLNSSSACIPQPGICRLRVIAATHHIHFFHHLCSGGECGFQSPAPSLPSSKLSRVALSSSLSTSSLGGSFDGWPWDMDMNQHQNRRGRAFVTFGCRVFVKSCTAGTASSRAGHDWEGGKNFDLQEDAFEYEYECGKLIRSRARVRHTHIYMYVLAPLAPPLMMRVRVTLNGSGSIPAAAFQVADLVPPAAASSSSFNAVYAPTAYLCSAPLPNPRAV